MIIHLLKHSTCVVWLRYVDEQELIHSFDLSSAEVYSLFQQHSRLEESVGEWLQCYPTDFAIGLAADWLGDFGAELYPLTSTGSVPALAEVVDHLRKHYARLTGAK